MNSQFRVLTSFLIALCFHLILFNLCTFVFPVAPDTPKPKFFFLGSILKQNDVKQVPPEERDSKAGTVFRSPVPAENGLRDMLYGTGEQAKNPFAIGTIKKPLIPHAAVSSKEKVVLKTTFETPPEKDVGKKGQRHPPEVELDIRPYRPLQLGSP